MITNAVDRLPIDPEFTVESPLVPKLSGQAAMDYVKATAAETKSVRVVQHIVEGNHVATLTENETINGQLSVFARFEIESGHIRSARVFYDARQIAGPSD